MELPRKYPYNSSLTVLVACLALACVFVCLFAHAARQPEVGLKLVPALVGWAGTVLFYWEMAGASLAVAGLMVMRIAQRMREERFLKFAQEDMVVPYGFFLVTDLRLPYAEVERVWEGKLFEKPVLYLKSGKRTLAIRPSRLPDLASYKEIREFLYSKVKLRRPEGGPGRG
jgi:hypothetical protein